MRSKLKIHGKKHEKGESAKFEQKEKKKQSKSSY